MTETFMCWDLWCKTCHTSTEDEVYEGLSLFQKIIKLWPQIKALQQAIGNNDDNYQLYVGLTNTSEIIWFLGEHGECELYAVSRDTNKPTQKVLL